MEEDGERALLEKLNGTEICDKIKEMEVLYDRLEADEKRFCDTFDIHCVEKCGKCCEHFTPDLTEAEAEYLAFGLISAGREQEVLERLKNVGERNGACPLYDFDSPYHCTVYRWRPLICRLFGASASDDKDGRPVFHSCKWNNIHKNLTPEVLESHREDVTEMGTYGLLLEETEEETQETELLPSALERAIGKIDLLIELEDESKESRSLQWTNTTEKVES